MTTATLTKQMDRLRGIAHDHDGGLVSIETGAGGSIRLTAHFTARDSAVSAAARYLMVLHAARVELIEDEDVADSARGEGYRAALIVEG